MIKYEIYFLETLYHVIDYSFWGTGIPVFCIFILITFLSSDENVFINFGQTVQVKTCSMVELGIRVRLELLNVPRFVKNNLSQI